MKSIGFLSLTASVTLLSLAPAMVSAQETGCEALEVPNPYLNAQFCARLKALADNRNVPPTRSVDYLDPETRKLVEGVGLIREAYEVDPAKALELIKRIRDAGGLAN